MDTVCFLYVRCVEGVWGRYCFFFTLPRSEGFRVPFSLPVPRTSRKYQYYLHFQFLCAAFLVLGAN